MFSRVSYLTFPEDIYPYRDNEEIKKESYLYRDIYLEERSRNLSRKKRKFLRASVSERAHKNKRSIRF